MVTYYTISANRALPQPETIWRAMEREAVSPWGSMLLCLFLQTTRAAENIKVWVPMRNKDGFKSPVNSYHHIMLVSEACILQGLCAG